MKDVQMLYLSGGDPSQKPRHKKGRPMGALSL
jgi:hypothetical protein